MSAELENPVSDENNNLSPVEPAMPDEISPTKDPTPSGEPLFTGIDPTSQDDDDYFQSISAKTKSEIKSTVDSEETPPIAQPVKPPLSSHKPAKLPDTIIPQRRATQPTLVTGKPVSNAENLILDTDMPEENDTALERKLSLFCDIQGQTSFFEHSGFRWRHQIKFRF